MSVVLFFLIGFSALAGGLIMFAISFRHHWKLRKKNDTKNLERA